MKKNGLVLFLLLCFICAVHSQIPESRNYFVDAFYIDAFNKAEKHVMGNYIFGFDIVEGKVKISKNDSARFEQLKALLISPLSETKNEGIDGNDNRVVENVHKNNASVTANGGKPKQGGVNAAGQGSTLEEQLLRLSTTVNTGKPVVKKGKIKAVTKAQNVMLEDLQKEEELVYLLLLLDGTPDDYANITNNIPRQFLYIQEFIERLSKSTEVRTGSTQSGLAGMVGGFSFEQALIYGITDFALKRAKQELMEAHLNYLYDKLNGDPVIKELIPNTLSIYTDFQKDGSLSMAKYGELWRAAFEEDLRGLPVKMQNEALLNKALDKVAPQVYNKQQIVPAVAGFNTIAYKIARKEHPVDVINQLGDKYEIELQANRDKVNAPVFKRMIIASRILLTVTGQMQDGVFYCVQPEDIKNLSDDGWLYLARLLYLRDRVGLEQLFGANPSSSVMKLDRASFTGSEILQLKSLISQTVYTVNTLQSLLSAKNGNSGNTAEEKKLSFNEVKSLLELSFELTDNAYTFMGRYYQASVETANFHREYERFVKPIAKSAIQIADGIATKQYGHVLDGTLQILSILNDKDSNSLGNTIMYLTKYGSFMVNIIGAKDSKAVETALDELIPKGQYKLKNATAFSVSLSLYPGGFFGQEYITKYRISDRSIRYDSNTVSKNPNASFFLPIGIDLNFGLKGQSSVNLFVQALDLGAVLNYRITNKGDTTQLSNPKLGFIQLLSPGISLMVHLPRSPIVIGAGCNFTPSLRVVRQEGVTYYPNAIRAGAILAVDVTAIHIALSKKTYKLDKKW